MLSYIVTYPTLTKTQSARELMRNARIPVRLIRQSRKLGALGCSYAIVIDDADWYYAYQLLRNAGVLPRKVFLEDRDGAIKQVVL